MKKKKKQPVRTAKSSNNRQYFQEERDVRAMNYYRLYCGLTKNSIAVQIISCGQLGRRVIVKLGKKAALFVAVYLSNVSAF